MKHILTTFAVLLFFGGNLLAQHAHFTTSGTIEYEKKVNMYAVIAKTINKDNEAWFTPAFDAFKKAQPQFKILKSTLSFTDNKSLFTPVEEDLVSNNSFFSNNPLVNQNNQIFNDLTSKTSISQKKIFGEPLLVKDSTRKIKWKITDETREIAGYTCRRANAIILDSVYVVAFFTTKISVSSGPESFSGLPGMILGVALPHENISWFATKVTEASVPPNAVSPPKKGKPVNNKTFKATLEAAFKDWGSEAPFYNKAFSL